MTKTKVFSNLIGILRPMDIAAHLDITSSAVSQWRHKGIPANQVLKIERLCRGKITRYQMRPDVFGDKFQPLSLSKKGV